MKISISFSSIEGIPAYNSKRTQVWLKENLMRGVGEGDPGFQLPDCNPFDHFACGVSELRVKANPPKKPET
jgi:hypothetical protein